MRAEVVWHGLADVTMRAVEQRLGRDDHDAVLTRPYPSLPCPRRDLLEEPWELWSAAELSVRDIWTERCPHEARRMDALEDMDASDDPFLFVFFFFSLVSRSSGAVEKRGPRASEHLQPNPARMDSQALSGSSAQ